MEDLYVRQVLLAISVEIGTVKPERLDRLLASPVSIDSHGDMVSIGNIQLRILSGRIDEDRCLVGERGLARLRPPRRIDQWKEIFLVSPITALAGKE